jgi:hypothetical protein
VDPGDQALLAALRADPALARAPPFLRQRPHPRMTSSRSSTSGLTFPVARRGLRSVRRRIGRMVPSSSVTRATSPELPSLQGCSGR